MFILKKSSCFSSTSYKSRQKWIFRMLVLSCYLQGFSYYFGSSPFSSEVTDSFGIFWGGLRSVIYTEVLKVLKAEILEFKCHCFFFAHRKLNLEGMSDYNFENKYCIFVFEFLICIFIKCVSNTCIYVDQWGFFKIFKFFKKNSSRLLTTNSLPT